MSAPAGNQDSWGEIDSAVVQKQLARILASPDFDAPERNRRFLRYVVEETLAGRGERIKAYGIAVTVFDRDDSFDAQSDLPAWRSSMLTRIDSIVTGRRS